MCTKHFPSRHKRSSFCCIPPVQVDNVRSYYARGQTHIRHTRAKLRCYPTIKHTHAHVLCIPLVQADNVRSSYARGQAPAARR